VVALAPHHRRRPEVDRFTMPSLSRWGPRSRRRAALENAEPVAVDLHELARRRTAHLAALEQWTRQAVDAGTDPVEVLRVVDDSFPLRVLSYAALNVAANTSIAVGGSVDATRDSPAVAVPAAPGRAVRARARAILTAHLHPGSVWFRNSLRAAVGLTLALLVARLGGFDNAFWVVLGTLAVLRSNVAGTGRSAVQAVAGNILGVVVAAGLMAVAAAEPVRCGRSSWSACSSRRTRDGGALRRGPGIVQRHGGGARR
jgi:uncharacterized membrane protein YccC